MWQAFEMLNNTPAPHLFFFFGCNLPNVVFFMLCSHCIFSEKEEGKKEVLPIQYNCQVNHTNVVHGLNEAQIVGMCVSESGYNLMLSESNEITGEYHKYTNKTWLLSHKLTQWSLHLYTTLEDYALLLSQKNLSQRHWKKENKTNFNSSRRRRRKNRVFNSGTSDTQVILFHSCSHFWF